MKTDNWYYIRITYPNGNSSILEHRLRRQWRFKTAAKYAGEIKETWAKNLKVEICLV